ncbi:GntR family transcriptional regulator [Ralstonia solanacearum]|nr:GntR family transcriptional regulator [Ralstonia solanacearum]MBT1538655.1 GntR family transcriptional regulator [Ralstonia solanacearum]QOK81832.1 GntR family transcriptional regulator [Ralstonia solanacearum]
MTVIQQTEERLRRMILDMEIGPGERLTERWLEGQTGASRSSIRTALFRLEAEGLVSRAERGWTVPPINLEEIEQLFIYREVLEVAAVRLGGRDIADADFLEIESVLDAAMPNATPEQFEAAGRQFHLWIAGIAHNAFISRGLGDALTRLQRVRWLESTPDHHGWDEHRTIIGALRKGDIDHAAALVEAHIRETRDRLLDVLRKDRRSLRARGATVLPA